MAAMPGLVKSSCELGSTPAGTDHCFISVFMAYESSDCDFETVPLFGSFVAAWKSLLFFNRNMTIFHNYTSLCPDKNFWWLAVKICTCQ